MKIAVDFDGTIVTHEYPKRGKEIPFAIETLKMLQKEQHQLILWTVREGDLLQEALDYCHKRGLDFYAVNASYPDEVAGSGHYSRKIKVDLMIDDAILGGLPDWGVIYEMVHSKKTMEEIIREQLEKKYRKRKWGFF